MLKVNFRSALDNFPLLNFTVSPGEKICFAACFSVDVTMQHENRKHILKIDKYERNIQETGKEQRQVQCPKQPFNSEKLKKALSFEVDSPFKEHEKF